VSSIGAEAAARVFAPFPDFRYVGLEPVPAKRFGVVATAFGLGAGVTLALSGHDVGQALVAGALSAIASGFALRGAGAGAPSGGAPLHKNWSVGSARMAIVPWGVLVETVCDDDESPRILRWAAVKKIELSGSPRQMGQMFGRTSPNLLVSIETEHERFVGESRILSWSAHGLTRAPLDCVIEHVGAWAQEQAAPIALELEPPTSENRSENRSSRVDEHLQNRVDEGEGWCGALLSAARSWLESGPAAKRLGLLPAGYRRMSTHAASPRGVELLRRVLRDRTSKTADPRAFAAVLAVELSAWELAPELVTLTQCPHPIVAAVAREGARRLGAPRARTGTLDEIAPFLTWPSDRARLEAWT
jgi:hypothetical protein